MTEPFVPGSATVPKRLPGHAIRWYARFPGHPEDWTPRTSRMLRSHFGWDVKCSCGFQTNTGGGVESWVSQLVWEHKWEAVNGFLDTDQDEDAKVPSTQGEAT